MKKRLAILAILAFSISSKAQIFQLIGDTANFGSVYENAPDSILVSLLNTGVYPVEIDRFVGFPYYGDTVVIGKVNSAIIGAGDTLQFYVKAQPEHNVKHKGALLLKMKDSPYGSAIIPYKFQGKYSKAYYNATENKTELALRSQISSIISSGTTSLSYNSARDEMYSDLDNVNGSVSCVYTGRTATFNTRAGATSNSFNCEHTWPQSLFNENLPMKSDIHHLFSTDETANSQRGSLPFGTVSNPSWTVGGSKKNSSTFEPRDVQKGATARAMMYFVLRYQDYSNFFSGQQTILRQWHEQYPPSATEISRNNGIYSLQNNRSPFVDYPQFSERITSLVGSTVTPSLAKLHVGEDTIHLARATSFSDTLIYTVNLYNYGNTDFSVNNLSLSNVNLQFEGNSGNNAILSPGQNLAVGIRYPVSMNFSGEEFTFSTTVPGMFNVDVPILSSAGIGLQELAWQPKLKITNTGIYWSEENTHFDWLLLDAVGRVVMKGNSSESDHLTFDGLAQGVYVFRTESSGSVFSQKISIANR